MSPIDPAKSQHLVDVVGEQGQPTSGYLYEWLLAEARWYAEARRAQRDRYIILLNYCLGEEGESEVIRKHRIAPWEAR